MYKYVHIYLYIQYIFINTILQIYKYICIYNFIY